MVCNNILTFDDEVAVTQEILIDEMIVAEMRAYESDTKEEEEKEDKQETEVSLMEKPSASQIPEALDLLFNFVLITGNKEMQHIVIKASMVAKMELTRKAHQSLL